MLKTISNFEKFKLINEDDPYIRLGLMTDEEWYFPPPTSHITGLWPETEIEYYEDEQ